VRLSLWREALTALPLLQAASDAIELRFVFNKPYKIQIKQNSESDAANAIRIYTDGSKTKEGSGCGVYYRSLSLRIKWGTNGTGWYLNRHERTNQKTYF